MELALQSLFGLHVHSCTHWLKPRNRKPQPPHLGSYARAQLVAKIDDIFCDPPALKVLSLMKRRGRKWGQLIELSLALNFWNTF
jgi:hypothetical protein